MDLTQEKREWILENFLTAVVGFETVVCRAFGESGYEPVAMKQTDDAFVEIETGDMNTAIDWISNRVDEGYHVAFKLIPDGTVANVILKYWEYPYSEPEWPA